MGRVPNTRIGYDENLVEDPLPFTSILSVSAPDGPFSAKLNRNVDVLGTEFYIGSTSAVTFNHGSETINRGGLTNGGEFFVYGEFIRSYMGSDHVLAITSRVQLLGPNAVFRMGDQNGKGGNLWIMDLVDTFPSLEILGGKAVLGPEAYLKVQDRLVIQNSGSKLIALPRANVPVADVRTTKVVGNVISGANAISGVAAQIEVGMIELVGAAQRFVILDIDGNVELSPVSTVWAALDGSAEGRCSQIRAENFAIDPSFVYLYVLTCFAVPGVGWSYKIIDVDAGGTASGDWTEVFYSGEVGTGGFYSEDWVGSDFVLTVAV